MKNKHALITGGNKGIGLETTKLFLNAGYKVSIVARDFSSMQEQPNCSFVKFDLRNVEDIKDLISDLDPVDVLVNNAGIMNTDAHDNYSDQNKRDLLKINLEAPVELINQASKGMEQRRHGRIVNVASIAGHIGHPDIWYGISKAGMLNLTKSYAKILGKHGILINAVAPGIVVTDMLNAIPQERQDAFMQNLYTQRFAKAEEVAKVIFWLGKDSPEYVNGCCIDINDGAFQR